MIANSTESTGVNNLGLMARVLLLRDDASPSEEESAKWQILQVSTFSIASCLGRILIGISLLKYLYFNDSDTLMCRCNSRPRKAHRDETCSDYRDSGLVFPRFPARRSPCSGYRAPPICGLLGRDLVWS